VKLRTAAYPCCRAHDLFDQPATYAMVIKRSLADEIYWFNWTTECSSDGSATIQVARLGDDAMFCRVYKPTTFGKARRSRGMLSRSDWSLVEDAVVAADFWMLDEQGERPGMTLGGTDWYLAGRRRRDYHYITRWSPHGTLWELGRLLFDLAGLEAIRL
jgi:hypothetical protein